MKPEPIPAEQTPPSVAKAREAIHDLVISAGLDIVQARAVLIAIASGQISHVKLIRE